MRWLLVIVLINGLNPSLREAAEAVVHYGASGHLPHSLPHEDDLGDLGAEHSCSPTEHRCGCCTGAPMTAALAPDLLSPVRAVVAGPQDAAARREDLAPERLFRPPIA